MQLLPIANKRTVITLVVTCRVCGHSRLSATVNCNIDNNFMRGVHLKRKPKKLEWQQYIASCYIAIDIIIATNTMMSILIEMF